MTVSLRRLVPAALIVVAALSLASPSFAQTSSLLSGQNVMAGVKFDSKEAQRPISWTVENPAPPLRVRQERGGVGFGVLGGIARTSLTAEAEGEDLGDFFETRTATMLGAWVGGNMNGRVGFVGEFIYLFRKVDIDADEDGQQDDELRFPAFAIPAVFHVNFGPVDRSKGMFYVIAGPVFTFNLSEKLYLDGTGEGIDLDEEGQGGGFKGADIGVLLGAGFEIFRVGFEVRHNWGMRNISDRGDLTDLKAKSWEILAKFRFN